MLWLTLLIPALRRQRQVDVYEYEASLVYLEFQVSQSYMVRPCLKNVLYSMCVHVHM